MNILSLENVSKTFGIKPLFSEVTFGLEERDKIGVIGANGSGKSTLLKVISGAEQTDTGRVVIGGGKVIAVLSQNPSFNPDHTVIEAVFEGSNEALHQKLEMLNQYEAACHNLAEQGGHDEKLMKKVSDLAEQLEHSGAWLLETEIKAMLQELGITNLNAKMTTLSGGQRKRVALAHSLFIHPDLLILDEPTNHLDAETVEWLERRLTDFKGALLLVTHDRYFLDRITNRIIEIEKGRVQSFTGNYGQYLEKKQVQEEQQLVEAQKLKQMARRELEWLRRGPQARTSKSKARIDKAHNLMTQSRQAASDIASQKTLDTGFDAFGSSRLGKKILGLEQISKSFDDKNIIKDFSYQFKRGDRIGIIGANGSGKTTLLEIISGRQQPDNGQVEKGETVKIGYYDQENREFDESMRLIDYLKEVAENIATADGNVITATQMLERFLFPRAMHYQTIASLSGGERRRLYLLRLLMSAPNLLLLDEITNDLDIPTLVALEEYLETFPGCLVVVSHDRYFLDRTIDYIFRFEPDDSGAFHIREYPGNYSGFMEIREREKEVAKIRDSKLTKTPDTRKKSTANSQSTSTGNRKLTFKEKRELAEVEERIKTNEELKAKAEAELTANGSDHVLVARLYEELNSLNASLDLDIERWTELAEVGE